MMFKIFTARKERRSAAAVRTAEPSATQSRQTIWIRTLGITALAALVFSAVLTTVAIAKGGSNPANHTLGGRLTGATALGVMMWLLWHLLMASRLICTEQGLVMPDFFYERAVAWGDIAGISTTRGFTLLTTSGKQLRPTCLGFSLIGQFTGYRQAGAAREQIRAFRNGITHGDSLYTGRIRIRPRLLAAAVILTLTSTLALVTQAIFH